jgi:uncharacterized cupredoxin-like copper-binding protein
MDRSYYPLVVIGALALALVISVALFLVLPIQPAYVVASSSSSETPTVSITLYAGEISGSKFGFGLSPNNITSPGPTFYFNTSDVVKITVVNAGHMDHAFAVVNAPQTGATVLFGATVASGSNPLQPGQSGSVTFKPNVASSNEYYICPVPGHAELGMWGSIVVSQG